jgi:hypothetical protein
MIWLLFWLLTKHLVADYLYQPPWMYLNKGKTGHIGGVAHAALHALLTFLILYFWTDPVHALAISLAEFTLHYYIDWGKTRINAAMGWKCNTTDAFWRLLGVDQYLHHLCYVGMIWWVTK